MTLKPFASGFVGDPACLVTTISTGLVVAVDVASVGFAAASEVRVETVLPEALSVSVAGEIAVDVVFTVSAEAVVDVGGGALASLHYPDARPPPPPPRPPPPPLPTTDITAGVCLYVHSVLLWRAEAIRLTHEAEGVCVCLSGCDRCEV